MRIRVRILIRMRRMRSSLVVRASDCQCTSCNGPGFDPSIRRHSGIWGAADEAVLNNVRRKKEKKIPQKNIEKEKKKRIQCGSKTLAFCIHKPKAVLRIGIIYIWIQLSDLNPIQIRILPQILHMLENHKNNDLITAVLFYVVFIFNIFDKI